MRRGEGPVDALALEEHSSNRAEEGWLWQACGWRAGDNMPFPRVPLCLVLPHITDRLGVPSEVLTMCGILSSEEVLLSEYLHPGRVAAYMHIG